MITEKSQKENRWLDFVSQLLKDLEGISKKDIEILVENLSSDESFIPIYWNIDTKELTTVGVPEKTYYLSKLECEEDKKWQKEFICQFITSNLEKLLVNFRDDVKILLLKDTVMPYHQVIGNCVDYSNYKNYECGCFPLNILRDDEIVEFFRIMTNDVSFQKMYLTKDGKLLKELEEFQEKFDLTIDNEINESFNIFFEKSSAFRGDSGIYSLLNHQHFNKKFKEKIYFKFWMKVLDETKRLSEDKKNKFFNKILYQFPGEKRNQTAKYLSQEQFNKLLNTYLIEGSNYFRFKQIELLVDFLESFKQVSNTLAIPETVTGRYWTKTFLTENAANYRSELLSKLNKHFPNSTFEFVFEFEESYSFIHSFAIVMNVLSNIKLSNVKFKLKEKDKEKLNLFLNQPELLTTNKLDTQTVLEILEYLKGED